MKIKEKMYLWVPYPYLNVNIYEKKYVWEFVKTLGWSNHTFHKYFKNIEKKLLENLRNEVNNLNNSQTLPIQWKLHMKRQWRMLSIFRDFHDFICGRDEKHFIRTDDCRRFMNGIEKGMIENHFIKPVHRILRGENSPKKFIHPLFKQFN